MNQYIMEDSHSRQLINEGQEDEVVCYGYKKNNLKMVLYYICMFCSLGTVNLLLYWKPEWELYLSCSPCHLKMCTYVLIQDTYKRYFVENVKKCKAENIKNVSFNETNASVNQEYYPISDQDINMMRYFQFRLLRYSWDDQSKNFTKIHGLDYKTQTVKLLKDYNGISASFKEIKLSYYGKNSIEVEVKSYIHLLFEEILSPFYIFQIASCILWFLDDYYYYATIIIVFSVVSMIISLIETRRQAQTLHDMTQIRKTVNVCRGNNDFEEVKSESLVPGDIIEIPSEGETLMTCDAILLNGNCVVNESMLTGESIPVIKTHLPTPETFDEIFNLEDNKRSTLFNGTNILQTRSYDSKKVLALVLRTGFSTSKGDLIRSIIYPKPMDFQFYKDSMKFIFFMFLIALAGMIYGITVLFIKGVAIYEIIIRGLDIITIVVPPALPAAMTVGTVYAQTRLKKKSIYCISPPRINVGGKLKLICFDKTGTLTEDGLDLWGVIKFDQNENFSSPINNIESLEEDCRLLKTLAACHSLTRFDGSLTGDPMDVKMFKSTKWSFIDEHVAGTCKFEQVTPCVKQYVSERETGLEIAIIKQFTFSSSLQRMSVLCKSLDSDHLDIYTKGAPEKILELCVPETIPENFHEFLKNYTSNGYRVIALAGKKLESSISWAQGSKISRDSIESSLEFYGFLIMQNRIKPETPAIINELREAALRTVMVTGDNLLTALNVARKCGMVPLKNKVILIEAHTDEGEHPRIDWKLADPYIDPTEISLETTALKKTTINSNYVFKFVLNDVNSSTVELEFEEADYNFAIDGKSFAILSKHFPDIYEKILLNGAVYARMSPDQKAQLVESLISIGYCVSMCGDGANDCGALKAAHVGISLSETEASVAAPFTSKIQNISCVPEIIKEGRCSLVTSFGVFKYMALYSMIQFISILLLYWALTNLSDPQFLYADLLLITPVAIFMSANKANEKISPKRPQGSLVSFVNMASIVFQIILVAVFQGGTLYYTEEQSWFIGTSPNDTDIKANDKTMEGTSVFLCSTFQYVALAFVYSKGPPYRKPIKENLLFMISLIILTCLNIMITVFPLDAFESLLRMEKLDPDHSISFYRISLLVTAFIFFILSLITEELIADTVWFKKFSRKITRKKKPKNKYKIIQNSLKNDKEWPLINKSTFSNNLF